MKKITIQIFLILILSQYHIVTFAQNVGIGLLTPAGKLHIKGSANVSQLILDAHSTQSNINPLIRLRNSNGLDLMGIHSDDTTNVFMGFKAGKVNVIGPQGINNTFIGSRAGYSNTNGRDNTAIGNNALFSNVKASLNTAIGTNALYTQSFSPGGAWWQSKNVAVGYETLYSNQPTNGGNGQSNTAVGTSAMRSNITGYENVAVGTYALYLNTTGFFNTATGYSALNSNTTGAYNTAVGVKAMFSNTGLSNNTAIGYAALFSQSNAPDNWLGGNVAVGYRTLYSNYPGAYYEGAQNTAVGNEALTNNAGGSSNTAIGYQSMFLNTYGYHNTAVGYHTLYENGGSDNTAVGWDALAANSTGQYNAAFGMRALPQNTTGENNAVVGAQALFNNRTGSNNVVVGFNADNDLDNRSNNTIIGSEAHVGLISNNCVAVGYGAFANVGNVALFGNTTSGPIGGYGTWTNFSDGRFKTDVQEEVIGLDFILRLRPVTYHMDIRALHRFWGIGDYGQDEDSIATETKALIDEAISKKESIANSGFIAQEVEQAAVDSGYSFSGLVKPAHEQDHYRIGYAEFVVPLVKGMQEQQAIIEKQQAQIDDLKSLITNMQVAFEKLQSEVKPQSKT